MRKLFKNMLPYWKGLIIVVALLVVQAWCDLSLPAYTSDIIDVGIQNKGIKHILPEKMPEEEKEVLTPEEESLRALEAMDRPSPLTEHAEVTEEKSDKETDHSSK